MSVESPWMQAAKPRVENLCQEIRRCIDLWGEDPTFSGVVRKLREVERELDLIVCSPGHRAALRSRPPSQSGQMQGERGAEDY